MPPVGTRRGSYVHPRGGQGGPPPTDSVVRDLASATEACQGRDSFEDDGQPVPVKVLGPVFENAAMAPPPPRTKTSGSSNADSLKVYCRLRPLNAGETENVIEATDEHTVRAMPLQRPGRHAHREARDYSFTHVFNAETAQQTVYESTTAPLVDALFEGQSGLLFTYGVTNAGKSYTMMGKPDGEQAGIMPRALDAVLERANRRVVGQSSAQAEVFVSFIEIYNENIFDLMDKTTSTKRRALRLKDRGDRMEINNLSSQRVNSVQHGLALARAAESQRKTAATGLNSTSSRSHSICQLEVRSLSKGKSGSSNSVVLMLVDLAGSERIERTGATATGAQQKEANHINQSVSRLMHCLRVLREKQAPTASISTVVPWRESKLTHLFQHLLAPPSGTAISTAAAAMMARVSMIVNVSPSAGDHAESCYVMGNAASAKAVAVRLAAPTAAALARPRTAAYGPNGRRLENNAATAAAAAVGPTLAQQQDKKRKIDKASSESTLSAATDDTVETAARLVAAGGNINEEVVARLQEQVEALQQELAAAQEAVSEVEHEVRTECATEMSQTIEGIQREYTRRLRARSSSVAGAMAHPGMMMDALTEAQDDDAEDAIMTTVGVVGGGLSSPKATTTSNKRDMCKSARQEQQRDELEKYIESLEEQFEETEAELDRVRKAAHAEAESLRAQLQAATGGGEQDDMDLDNATAASDNEMGAAMIYDVAEDDAAAAAREEEERRQVAVLELQAALQAALKDADAWKARSELSEALNVANAESERLQAANRVEADRDAREHREAVSRECEAQRAEAVQLKAKLLEAQSNLRQQQQQREKQQQAANGKSPTIVAIYSDDNAPPLPGVCLADANSCLDALKSAPSPHRNSPIRGGGGQKQRTKSSSKASNNASPLRENSPIVSRSVKEVASSLDARARKIKDERIARAKAQQTGGPASPPVAKRTRGYKVL